MTDKPERRHRALLCSLGLLPVLLLAGCDALSLSDADMSRKEAEERARKLEQAADAAVQSIIRDVDAEIDAIKADSAKEQPEQP